MTEPALLEVAWTDPVTGCRGYLVIDRLVRGVASGGLRMRRGCTLFEVRGLARGMTLKEGLNYDPDGRDVPLGGAKGGIDDVIAEIGLLSSVQAVYPLLEDRAAATERLADAFRIEVGGLVLDELVGGLGVAQATLTGLEMLGLGGPNRVVVTLDGLSLRAAALQLSEKNLDAIQARFG
jgi:glutamate dehydrogenase (NAD(P)+)